MEHSSLRDAVLVIEHAMRQQTPEQLQAAADAIGTFHYFADGMYARVLARKAGVQIVGKVRTRPRPVAWSLAVEKSHSNKKALVKRGKVLPVLR